MSTLAARASRWARIDADGEPLARDRMAEILSMVQGAAPAHLMNAIRTWLGGWSTAFLLQRGVRCCRFGCHAPGGVYTQEHLLTCPALWAPVCEVAAMLTPHSCREAAALTLRQPGGADRRRRRRRRPPASLLRLSLLTDVYHRAVGGAMAESRMQMSRARLIALSRDAMVRLGSLWVWRIGVWLRTCDRHTSLGECGRGPVLSGSRANRSPFRRVRVHMSQTSLWPCV